MLLCRQALFGWWSAGRTRSILLYIIKYQLKLWVGLQCTQFFSLLWGCFGCRALKANHLLCHPRLLQHHAKNSSLRQEEAILANRYNQRSQILVKRGENESVCTACINMGVQGQNRAIATIHKFGMTYCHDSLSLIKGLRCHFRVVLQIFYDLQKMVKGNV